MIEAVFSALAIIFMALPAIPSFLLWRLIASRENLPKKELNNFVPFCIFILSLFIGGLGFVTGLEGFIFWLIIGTIIESSVIGVMYGRKALNPRLIFNLVLVFLLIGILGGSLIICYLLLFSKFGPVIRIMR